MADYKENIKTVQQHIESLLETFKPDEYILVDIWNADDVRQAVDDEDAEYEDLIQALGYMNHHYSCTNGFTWGTAQTAYAAVMDEKESGNEQG